METFDEIMMQRVAYSDDQKAFEYIYHYYYSRLCSYVSGFISNYDDAEDLVNDCFFELWKNRKTLVIQSSLKSYLFISVRNKSINFLKKNISKQKYLSELSYPNAFQEEITIQSEKLLSEDNLEENLKKAIEKLPSQCRYIFYLNRFEGMKYKEIAKKMNLAEATIKTQIARALKSLRNDLHNLKTNIVLFLFFKTNKRLS